MLNLSERTYYRYKQKLYEKYGAIQRQKTEETIALQQEILFERLISLFKIVDQKMKEDSKDMRGSDMAVLTETARDLAVDILKLETEGFRTTNMKLANITTKDEINKILEKAKEKKETEKQADDARQDHSVNVDVENDN